MLGEDVVDARHHAARVRPSRPPIEQDCACTTDDAVAIQGEPADVATRFDAGTHPVCAEAPPLTARGFPELAVSAYTLRIGRLHLSHRPGLFHPFIVSGFAGRARLSFCANRQPCACTAIERRLPPAQWIAGKQSLATIELLAGQRRQSISELCGRTAMQSRPGEGQICGSCSELHCDQPFIQPPRAAGGRPQHHEAPAESSCTRKALRVHARVPRRVGLYTPGKSRE